MTDQDEDIRAKINKFLASCIQTCKKNMNWGHVIGCEDAKRELYHHIVLPHKLSESVHRFDERYPTPGDVLIEGVNGSGRTKLAHTVASMCKADFLCVVNVVEMVTHFGIESSSFVRVLFETAEKYKRSIIVMRHMDCFEHDCNWLLLPAKREIKNQMEFWKERFRFANGELNSVTVIGTTKKIPNLDFEIAIRFRSRTFVELPNAKERFQMFQMFFGDACLTLKEKDWKIVVENTEGLTGGNLKTLCENVIENATKYMKLRATDAEPEATCITLASFSPWISVKRRIVPPLPPERAIATSHNCNPRESDVDQWHIMKKNFFDTIFSWI